MPRWIWGAFGGALERSLEGFLGLSTNILKVFLNHAVHAVWCFLCVEPMIWEYDQIPDMPGVTTGVGGSVYGKPWFRAVLTSAAKVLAHTT